MNISTKYFYQNYQRYFAQVADDIKEITIKEITELGAYNIQEAYRGLHFHSSQEDLYKINYHSRFINRVLAPLIIFDCHSDKYLYKTARDINWDDFLNEAQTFAVFATTTNSNIKHSQYAALRLKDAIVDYFRDKTNSRPSIDTREPDLWVNLYIDNNRATISIDTSGGSLHRRGYRRHGGDAPMIETLAASIIEYSEWDGTKELYDPFCGSGTFLAEAYLYATQTPPSILRQKFGFEKLPDYNPFAWSEIKEVGLKNIKPIPDGLISGSDISTKVVKAANYNCSFIDHNDAITIEQKDIFEIESLNDKIIICNPPYGIRMGKELDLSLFYKNLGDFLKQKCTNSTAFIYFGEREFIKDIGLKPSWKRPLHNGALDGRLVKIELY